MDEEDEIERRDGREKGGMKMRRGYAEDAPGDH